MPRKVDPRQIAVFSPGPPMEKPRRPAVSVPIKGDVIEHEEDIAPGAMVTLIDTATGHTHRARYCGMTGPSEVQLKWGASADRDGVTGDFVYLSTKTGRLKGGRKLSKYRVTTNCLRRLR